MTGNRKKPTPDRASAKRAKLRYAHLLAPSDPWPAALRALLSELYRESFDAADAAGKGDVKALHDMRVAGRRFRSGLRCFRKELKVTRAPTIEVAMQTLLAMLGPIRDSQLMLARCETSAKRPPPSRTAVTRHLSTLRRREQAQRTALRRFLRGKAFHNLRHEIESWLHETPPYANPSADTRPFAVMLAARLLPLYKTIKQQNKHVDHFTPLELHSYRKRVRRLRYWSEFAAPVSPEPVSLLVRYAEKAADWLGKVHDIDVHIERLNAVSAFSADADLSKGLRRKRTLALRRATQACHALAAPAFSRKLIRCLERTAIGSDTTHA